MTRGDRRRWNGDRAREEGQTLAKDRGSIPKNAIQATAHTNPSSRSIHFYYSLAPFIWLLFSRFTFTNSENTWQGINGTKKKGDSSRNIRRRDSVREIYTRAHTERERESV
jgi:hypothetical protein